MPWCAKNKYYLKLIFRERKSFNFLFVLGNYQLSIMYDVWQPPSQLQQNMLQDPTPQHHEFSTEVLLHFSLQSKDIQGVSRPQHTASIWCFVKRAIKIAIVIVIRIATIFLLRTGLLHYNTLLIYTYLSTMFIFHSMSNLIRTTL